VVRTVRRGTRSRLGAYPAGQLWVSWARLDQTGEAAGADAELATSAFGWGTAFDAEGAERGAECPEKWFCGDSALVSRRGLRPARRALRREVITRSRHGRWITTLSPQSGHWLYFRSKTPATRGKIGLRIAVALPACVGCTQSHQATLSLRLGARTPSRWPCPRYGGSWTLSQQSSGRGVTRCWRGVARRKEYGASREWFAVSGLPIRAMTRSRLGDAQE
jgi:hypothetical protein